MSQAQEVVARLASCLCEGEEVDVDTLRAELAGRIHPLLADALEGPGATLQAGFEAAGEGFGSVCTWAGDAPRLAWALGQEGLPTGVCAVLGWPHGRVLGDALCFECAMLAQAGVAEVCLAANSAAIAEGEFDEVMDPVMSVIRTARDDCDDEECGCGCEDDHGDGECGCGRANEHEHGDEACASEGTDASACEDDCGSDDASGHGHSGEVCACEGHDHENACACGHNHDDEECGFDAGYGSDDAHACGHDHEDDEDCCDGDLAVSIALECGRLTAEQLCQACDVVSSAGPDYIVACTGAGPRCATPEDVRLLCATAEPGVAVRATTDARTVEEALALFEAGAVELLCLHATQVLVDFDRLAAELAL